MDEKQIKVFQVNELRVYGKEVRLHRCRSGLSLATIASRMSVRGWSYYPTKLYRLEARECICLPSAELMDLLACLNLTPDIT
jgi:hypothetical protein